MSEAYHGEFWLRRWTSNADISSELQGSFIDTPMKRAIVDVCCKVEPLEAFADVFVRAVEGGFLVEAKVGKACAAVRSEKCFKCGAAVYLGEHPFNGCERVVVDEVMLL